MIKRLNELMQEARKLNSASEIRQASIALVRIILQHACIALAELSYDYRKLHPADSADQIPLPLEQLRAPSDGTLVSSLGELLIAAENDGWNGISKIFWSEIPAGRPCIRLIKSGDAKVDNLLANFIALRNDSVEGHGIPGNFDPEAELDLVEILVEKLSSLLPHTINSNGELIVDKADGTPYSLKLLRSFDGDLVCYRKIQKNASRKCTVRAQHQKSLFTREDLTYEAEDILGDVTINYRNQYEIKRTYDENWSPLVVFPERLTTHFTGREKELQDILNQSRKVNR